MTREPSADWRDLCHRRADRAAYLAPHHPASAEVLEFAARLARLQADLPPDPAQSWPLLRNFLVACAPNLLREKALGATTDHVEETCDRLHSTPTLLTETTQPNELLARLLLQPRLATMSPNELPTQPNELPTSPHTCPRCGAPPQCGLLTPLAFGRELSLVCALCLHLWKTRRGICPHCAECDESKLSFFQCEGFSHIQMQTCGACRRYLHLIDQGEKKEAVPDIDELLALPMDLWAAEQGYRKIVPNLAGL